MDMKIIGFPLCGLVDSARIIHNGRRPGQNHHTGDALPVNEGMRHICRWRARQGSSIEAW